MANSDTEALRVKVMFAQLSAAIEEAKKRGDYDPVRGLRIRPRSDVGSPWPDEPPAPPEHGWPGLMRDANNEGKR